MTTTQAGAPGRRLLLVDDDEANRLTMTALLEDEGFEVESASSFVEARARIEREPEGAFAAVLTDEHLGDGLGSDLVPLIRLRHGHARIVQITGSGPTQGARTFDLLIEKGTNFPTILEALLGLLGQR